MKNTISTKFFLPLWQRQGGSLAHLFYFSLIHNFHISLKFVYKNFKIYSQIIANIFKDEKSSSKEAQMKK